MTDFSMITTRGGDEGKSSLIGGERRFKSDEVFIILGEIDELTSFLGIARAVISQRYDEIHQDKKYTNHGIEFTNHLEDYAQRLHETQDTLQKLGGIVALSIHKAEELGPQYLGAAYTTDFWQAQIQKIESWQKQDVDQITLKGFILPGDSLEGAHLDVARTVCRRLERGLVGYVMRLGIDYLKVPQQFINRLSDWLFIMARWLEQHRD